MPQITLLTGPERRRRWSDDERRRILAAAFSPGAVVATISRQFEVSTSLIYKWRQQRALAAEPAVTFAPAVMLAEPVATTPPDTTAIIVELANGVRLKIGAHASTVLVMATLRALR
jgi:transposase